MTQTTQEHPASPAPGAPPHRGRRPAVAPVPLSPARPRRRPALIGVGVALVALGGLTTGWLVRTTSTTVPVVALARDVQQGEALTRGDLALVDVRLDPSVPSVPAGQVDSVVGSVAATRLLAGSLLAPGATTDQVVPTDGDSLVGVALTASQRPGELLVRGDAVRIVDTPTAQADPPVVAPDAIRGEVVSVTDPDPAGVSTVDVLVPSDEAGDLAARAATGRVALVLDSRER